MKRTLIGVAAVAAGGAGVMIGRRAVLGPAARRDDGRDRWHCVTVNCAPERLGPVPPPLDALEIPIEVRLRPAPGDRGTELAARLVQPPAAGPFGGVARWHDDDPVQLLRRALREVRSLAEVGEVLLPGAAATAHRTLTGVLPAHASGPAREEGRR